MNRTTEQEFKLFFRTKNKAKESSKTSGVITSGQLTELFDGKRKREVRVQNLDFRMTGPIRSSSRLVIMVRFSKIILV
jgi:hypothetical protein